MSERLRAALLWLDEHSRPGALHHSGPNQGVYAWALQDHLIRLGLGAKGRRWTAQGAANTLVALKRRGLATNSTPGGEAFQSCVWAITEEGQTEARRLR